MTAPESTRAWIVVAAATVAHAVPFGLVVYSFTVFVPPILEEFDRGQGSVAWIVALASALMLATGGVSGALTERFGARRVLVAGALLTSAGMALATLSTSVWHLVATYGLLAGAGASMAFIPAIASVGRLFDRRRGLALGLASAGSGLGTIMLAPVATALIDAYDWRVAMRLLAAGSLALLLAAASLMPSRVSPAPTTLPMGEIRRTRALKLMLIGSFFGAFGYWVPFVFMAPYAEAHGLSAATAATIVAVMGVGNTLGRIVLGAVADRAGRLQVLQGANAVMAVTLFTWPLATTLLPLSLFGLAYALAAGAFIAVLPALAGDYFGAERVGSVTGYVFAAAALGTLVSTPVAGMIIDATGSYAPGSTIAAVTLAIGAVPLFMLRAPHRAPAPGAHA